MKMILTLSLTLSFFLGKAQVEFGATAGVAYANLHERIFDKVITADKRPGFTAGILANIPIRKSIQFQPGVNYLNRRMQISQPVDGSEVTMKLRYHYIEVPLNILFRTNNKDENAWAGFGPSFNFAMSGEIEGEYQNKKESREILIGNSEEDDMQPIDITGNVFVGFETKSRIVIVANYNFGLSNLYPDKQSREVTKNFKLKSSYWGVRVVYLIRKRNTQ